MRAGPGLWGTRPVSPFLPSAPEGWGCGASLSSPSSRRPFWAFLVRELTEPAQPAREISAQTLSLITAWGRDHVLRVTRKSTEMGENW